jgi:hypothetical protein
LDAQVCARRARVGRMACTARPQVVHRLRPDRERASAALTREGSAGRAGTGYCAQLAPSARPRRARSAIHQNMHCPKPATACSSATERTRHAANPVCVRLSARSRHSANGECAAVVHVQTPFSLPRRAAASILPCTVLRSRFGLSAGPMRLAMTIIEIETV